MLHGDGVNELQQICEYKYLGIWMSPNGCEKIKNEKISMVNQWVGRQGSAARMRANKPAVLREICKCGWSEFYVWYGSDCMD